MIGTRSLVALVLAVGGLALLLVAMALLIADARGESLEGLFTDSYSVSGSRLTGIVTASGIAILAGAAAVALFAAAMVRRERDAEPWAAFLLGAGLLTGVLATDDYLALHELAGSAAGGESDRLIQRAMEVLVLGGYGLLFAAWIWFFRGTVTRTEYALLAIAGSLLAASLVLDLAPHSTLESTFGITLEAQAVIEDTIKFVGIAIYATYVVRTAARALRSSPPLAG